MHALSANVIRLMISVVMTLVLPRILGVEEYSYWQLYLFYVTYTAYSSIGWCEGTYLKYGGMEYAKLDRSRMAVLGIGSLSVDLLYGFWYGSSFFDR